MSAQAEAVVAPLPRAGRDAAPHVALWRLARADFLERARRPAYLVSLLVMVWLVHGMMPSSLAGYRTFTMQNEYRPAYGPEWVGTLVGILSGLYFVLVGFYLVKGSVLRDRLTGVGPILFATRLSRLRYLAGKALSNVLVLASMLAVAFVVELVTQQLLGEDRRFDPVAVAVPLVALALPAAAVVGSMAVLIECIPGLAGGLGNVVWFVVSMGALSAGVIDSEGRAGGPDLLGFATVAHGAYVTLHALHPEVPLDSHALSMGVNVDSHWAHVREQVFPWPGLVWDAGAVGGRLLWLAVALACVGLASLVFDRFERPVRARAVRGPRGLRWPFARAASVAASTASVRVATLPAARRGHGFTVLVRAELALLLHGRDLVWALGAAGLGIACLLAPLAAVRSALLPILSIWPVLVLGDLGSRERVHGTEALLFSAPRPVARQLAAAWLAGALLLVALGAAGTVRLLLAGSTGPALGWLLGAATVPALALALGTWTGGSKAFEALMMFAWYVGPMHAIARVDYTGVTAPRTPALWLAWGTLPVVLLALARVGRARRVRA